MLLKRILLALILIAHVGGSLNAQKLEKVTLQLKWQHQFQFAGYYAAQAKGFYKEVGIDVDIIDYIMNKLGIKYKIILIKSPFKFDRAFLF